MASPLPTTFPARDASGRPRPAHYAGLDGLRAIAVAAVLVYHLFPGALPGGFLGVDIFFVISGFLITTLLLAEKSAKGRISLGGFWKRRVRRLVPALVALVLVCSSAAWLIGGDILVGLGRQVLGAMTFSNNWLDIVAGSNYFDQDVPELFRNLWSLAVEEQFYLLWPIATLGLLLLTRTWARVGIVATLAVASGVWMAVAYGGGGDATRVYFGTDTHSFGLMIGATLALLVRELKPLDLDAGETRVQRFVRRGLAPTGVVSLAFVLAATWVMADDAAFTYRGGMFLVSLLTGVAIWAAVSPGSRLGRMLDVRPLRDVGIRSYGLYLWHWPLLLLVQAAFPRAMDRVANALLIGAITLVLTVAAAWISYRWVEQPIRRHGIRGSARRIRARIGASTIQRHVTVAGLAVVAVTLAGTVAGIASAPQSSSAKQLIERGAQALAHDAATPAPKTTASAAPAPSASAAPAPAPTPAPTPTPGPTPGPDGHLPIPTGDNITAIGDSVMLAAAPELQAAFPGISIDAAVSRSMYAAPGILQSLLNSGSLRDVVVLGLGTNGPVSMDTLAEVRRILGPERELILVNAQAPRSWTDGVNSALADFSRQNRRSVGLADWKDAIAPHLDVLADDEIHPGATGGRIYAQSVRDALQRLADMPPPKHIDLRGPGPIAG